METSRDNRFMDTVLTLRGHQVTLRQAIAEGIIKGYFDPVTGKAEVNQINAEWFIEGQKKPDTA